MAAAELTGERRSRAQVHAPVEARHGRVKLPRVARLEVRDLKVNAVGDARPEAGAIGAFQGAGERDPTGGLADLLGPARSQFADQQVGESARRTDQEPGSGRAHAPGRRGAGVTTDRARSS